MLPEDVQELLLDDFSEMLFSLERQDWEYFRRRTTPQFCAQLEEHFFARIAQKRLSIELENKESYSLLLENLRQHTTIFGLPFFAPKRERKHYAMVHPTKSMLMKWVYFLSKNPLQQSRQKVLVVEAVFKSNLKPLYRDPQGRIVVGEKNYEHLPYFVEYLIPVEFLARSQEDNAIAMTRIANINQYTEQKDLFGLW